MASIQEPGAPGSSVPPFRVDGELHELLTQPLPVAGGSPPSLATPEVLPEPVFPQHPELLVEDHPDDWDSRAHPENPYRRRWTAPLICRSMRGWLFPYIKSRVLPHDFHPIISYLFTEWKCNLDCHYCWAFDNHVTGMTEDTAKRSINWLCSTVCRVLALMGGEVLLRPQFVHKILHYAAQKRFWVYLPTNSRLLRPGVTDRTANAGVAVVNFAVDAVDEKPGLPKALAPVRKYFDYVDGSLAPCFPMYSSAYDWGTVEKHKFEVEQLDQMKQCCQRHCFSTLNHNLGYCYNDARVIRWALKQARCGFRGLTGSFD